MNNPSPTLVVHIVEDGTPYCGMPKAQSAWPDHHLFISSHDEENAKEANCPDCVSRRDSGPQLFERLNKTNPEAMVDPGPALLGSAVRWTTGVAPSGVLFDSTGLHAVDEAGGQAAHFDLDLGRWQKLG